MRLDKIKNKDGGRGWCEEKEYLYKTSVCGSYEHYDLNPTKTILRKLGSLNLKCDVKKMAEIICPKNGRDNKAFMEAYMVKAERLAQRLSEFIYLEETE